MRLLRRPQGAVRVIALELGPLEPAPAPASALFGDYLQVPRRLSAPPVGQRPRPSPDAVVEHELGNPEGPLGMHLTYIDRRLIVSKLNEGSLAGNSGVELGSELLRVSLVVSFEGFLQLPSRALP